MLNPEFIKTWASNLSPGSFLTATGSGGIWEPPKDSESLLLADVSSEVLRGWQRYFLEQAQSAFDAGARYGAFIILCAFIHNLASHAHDGEVNGDEFRKFVREFLPGYDAAALWDNFRCALFHRGVPGTPSGEKGVVLTANDADHDPDGSRGTNPKSITIAFGKFHADLLFAGRVASVSTISQSANTSIGNVVTSYSKIYDIASSVSGYDEYLGLKTVSSTKWWGTSGAYSQGRRQYYLYDSLDQLSQCDFYNLSSSDVESSHTTSYWYYDAAGNRYTNSDRDDHTYTNLNMMTDSPGSLDYENDALGNRTWREKDTAYAWKYVWDSVNRMTQAIGYNGGATYKYRADGMRVKKVGGYSMSWNPPVGETGGFYTEVQVDTNPTYRYFYDGQMCFEDDYLDDDDNYYGTRYGQGARGVDFMQTFGSGGSESGRMFPVYDGHGNMICTVARNGTSGYYAPKDVKEFGPWGDVRNSANASDLPPNKGYCANLGHKADDESGLVYMRARYYEPSTGRFISPDSSRQGINWYSYCINDPINYTDESGHARGAEELRQWVITLSSGLGFLWFLTIGICLVSSELSAAQAAKAVQLGILIYAIAQEAANPGWFVGIPILIAEYTVLSRALSTIVSAAEQGKRAPRQVAVVIGYVFAHSMLLFCEIFMDFAANGVPGQE